MHSNFSRGGESSVDEVLSKDVVVTESQAKSIL